MGVELCEPPMTPRGNRCDWLLREISASKGQQLVTHMHVSKLIAELS